MLSHRLPEPADPARVVVLGAGGFVGRAMVTGLINAGIRALALRSTDLDLTTDAAGQYLAEQLRPHDAVIMLATLTPDRSRGVAAFMSNLKMGAAVAHAVDQVHPAQVIYFSSAAVYPTSEHPVTEETPAAPKELFGMMHLAREMMLKTVTHGPLAIVRPTQIHGPVIGKAAGSGHDLAFGPNLLRRLARSDGRIVLSGSGEERRDYIAIGDVVELTLRILRRRSHGVLNLATGRSIALKELAEKIAGRFNPPVPVEHGQRESFATHRFFDIAALKAAFPDFGFTPLDQALDLGHQEKHG